MLRPKPIPVTVAIRKLVASGDRDRLRKAFGMLHPADLAVLLPDLPEDQLRLVVEVLLKLRKAGATLAELPPALMAEVLDQLDDAVVTEVIKRLPPDDAVDLLQELEDERRHLILNALNISEAAELRQLMQYSPESAGGIMTTEFFSLRDTKTAGEAVEAIRKHGQDSGLYYMYVLDAQGRLRGILTLMQLLLAKADRPISEFMIEEVYTVGPTVSQEDAAKIFARYNLLALPVVDETGLMLGVISIDDIVDVIQEEATEDIYLMAGLSQDDRVFTSWFDSVKLRLPWLVINLATAILATLVVAIFEPALAELAILAVFMPIVPGMGGNAATQTITVMVRGMALGELTSQNVRGVVFKEIYTALVNGTTTGLIGAAIAYFWKGNLMLGVVLLLAMVFNNVVAALSGTLIPLTLKRMGMDPAIASSIFVTTFTDIFGFFSFLGLATVFLNYLM